MNSPFTGKAMQIVREADTLTFRKEQFEVVYHYYFCEDSGERFTDDRLDMLNMTQVTNQYRERHGTPFPEEIRLILSVREPEEFLRQVQASSHILSDREQQKFMDRAHALVAEQQIGSGRGGSQIVLRDDAPSAFNGYRRLSLSRTAQVIAYFGEHVGSP